MSAETEAPTEDVVSKYRRLLTLARSSLEANQTSIAAKDKYILNFRRPLTTKKLKGRTKSAEAEEKTRSHQFPETF